MSVQNAARQSTDATGAGTRASRTYARNADTRGHEIMGDVVIIVKVMPESPDVDLEALKSAIKAKYPGTKDIQEEPIGFGLSSLKVAIVIPDGQAGASEEAETILASIDGVQSAEIVSLTLT